ncbi:MAG: complex I subunit 5 family protein, partial [Bacillota bacterium]
ASLRGARYLPYILALFTVGFGIKAGIFPLHLWMPGTYAVSPAPVNAISSGLMIKTGIYGITRLLVDTLDAPGGELLAGSSFPGFGMILIWAGVITMFVGAAVAIFQSNVLRTLAYSSVSQIGYITMGLGVAVYLGSEGAMGVTGSIYHVINHSLFKAALFLIAGAIYFSAGGLNRDRLGGLGRQLPLLAGIFLVAALGLGGIPGFNGYASKTVLHHAIVEAYEHHHQGMLWLAEWIFTVTGALTLCYAARLFKTIFLGEGPSGRVGLKPLPLSLRVPLLALAGAITFFGLFPHLLLERVFIPLGEQMGYGEYAIDHVAHVDVWSGADLLSSGKVLLLAGIIYLVLSRIDSSKLRFPRWMRIDELRLPEFEVSAPSWLDPERLDIPRPKVEIKMPRWLRLETIAESIPDQDEAPSWLNIHTLVYRPVMWISALLILLPVAAERSLERLYHIFMGGRLWATIKEQLPVRSSEWDLRNLNLDALIVIGMITGLLLFLIFYFT